MFYKMTGSHVLRYRWKTMAFGLCLLVLLMNRSAKASDNELDSGYRNMYNLDFASAHTNFGIWMKSHPEDPLGPVSDAAAFLFSEFDRLGVLDIELFSDDDRFTNRKRPSADPAVRSAFDSRLQQGEHLADAVLAKAPSNAEALYAKMLIYGLRSDYAALIDKSDLTALRLSEQAAAFAQRALAVKPDLYDAHLATGAENYILSLKPAPVRWFINITGGATNKKYGISELTLAAQRGHHLAPFARLILAVAELRDGHKDQARSLLASLAQEFPGNTLYRRQLDRIH
jgi:hypothetical protein